MTASILAQVSEFAECKPAVEVLLIGPWDKYEFADLLPSIPESSNWQLSTNCPDAAALVKETEFAPELILLANPLPDIHSEADIAQLQLAAPLARLIVVAGTWCEGEVRTGTPLAGILRLYWYELPGWWQSAMATLERGECPLWSQPMDGPLTGRNVCGPSADSQVLAGNIAIDTMSYETFEALATALKTYGADCCWTRRGEMGQLSSAVIAGIWDGSQLEPLELERLRSFVQEISMRGGTVVALLDFPRREHLAMVRDAGCCGVLGKPFVVEEMVSRIMGLR